MKSVNPEIIQKIAEQLNCGLRAFVHRTTKQLLFVPNLNSPFEIELEPWAEELEELEKNEEDYFEIDRWTSSDAYNAMVDFTEQLSNRKLQIKLSEALERRKPFREFNFVIDNSGEYRDAWFEFRDEWQRNFVARQLKFIWD